MPTSHRYFKRVRISSNSKCRACCSACTLADKEASVAMWSKNPRKRSIDNNIRSCKHRPGNASNWLRVHAVPCGRKRLSAGIAAKAPAWLPMRHNKLSVCNRAPLHSPQVV